MRPDELRQIRALRRAVDAIDASRRPIPATMASDYAAAKSSLATWEAIARDPELGFAPLIWFFAGGVILSLGAIAYTVYKVMPEVTQEVRSTLNTVGTATRFGTWALLGIGLYTWATRRR